MASVHMATDRRWNGNWMIQPTPSPCWRESDVGRSVETVLDVLGRWPIVEADERPIRLVGERRAQMEGTD